MKLLEDLTELLSTIPNQKQDRRYDTIRTRESHRLLLLFGPFPSHQTNSFIFKLRDSNHFFQTRFDLASPCTALAEEKISLDEFGNGHLLHMHAGHLHRAVVRLHGNFCPVTLPKRAEARKKFCQRSFPPRQSSSSTGNKRHEGAVRCSVERAGGAGR